MILFLSKNYIYQNLISIFNILFLGTQSAPLWEHAKSIRFDDSPTSKEPVQSIQKNSYQARNLKQSASITSLVSPSSTTSPRTPSIQLDSSQMLPLNKSMSSLTINTSCRSQSNSSRRLSLVGMNRRLNYSDSSSSEASPTESRSSTVVPRGIVARRMKAFTDSLGRTPIVDTSKRQRHKSEREPAKSKSDWDLRKMNDDIPQTRQSEKMDDTDSVKSLLCNQVKHVDKDVSREQYMEELEASPNDLPVRDSTSTVASNYLDLNSTPCKESISNYF